MADDKAVPVVTQSGKVGFLPEAFAKDATTQGVRRATDAEMQAAQRKANAAATEQAVSARFEGHDAGLLANLEGQFAPSIAGGLRGLTFGGSDQAAVGLGRLFGGESGAQSVADRLSDYKEYDPLRSATGELAGVTAHALVGDEAGAASSLARTVGRGAIDGAVYGAGDAASEAALKNHALTAESIIGGAMHGALGGAVASGVLGGAAKAYRALRPDAAALGRVASTVGGHEVPGVGEEIARHMKPPTGPFRKPSTLADSIAGGYIDNIPGASAEERARLGDVFANREKAFASRAELTEKATRETASALDDVQKFGRQTDMATFGEAKKIHTEKLIGGDFAEQKAATEAFFDHADGIVQGLSTDANSTMTKGDLKRWNAWVKEARGATDGAQLYGTLDDAKRWMGKEAEFGRGPFGLSRATKEFDSLYHGADGAPGIMPLLESKVWGEGLSSAQREINSATANMLSQGKLFTRKFTTEYGSELGRPLYRADPASISGFYGRLTSASNDLDAEAAQNFIGARRRYLDAVERNYEQTAAGAKAISAERAGLDKMERTFKTATTDVSRVNQVAAALSEERERSMGGAVGAVLGLTSQPYTNLRRIAMAEQQTAGMLAKVGIGAKAIVGGEAKSSAAKTSARSGVGFFTSLLDGATNATGRTTSIASRVGGSASQQLFAKRADQIGALTSSPDRLTEQVARGLEPIGASSPKITAEAVGVAARGVSFLQSKLPSLRIDSYSLQPTLQRPRASDAEVSKFFRYTEALDNPLIVLQEAKSGSLSRDHVEAVKAVYPELYGQMRGAIFQQLTTRKTRLPYAKEVQLGILLDLPTNKTLTPQFISAIQGTYTAAESAGQAQAPLPPAGNAPDIASGFQTDMQSATTEGVSQ